MRARVLDARYLDTERGCVRIGIVVPKFGFTAVRRNTLKRQLRELARLHALPLTQSRDVVLRVRPEAYRAEFAALRDDVTGVMAALDSGASRTGTSPTGTAHT